MIRNVVLMISMLSLTACESADVEREAKVFIFKLKQLMGIEGQVPGEVKNEMQNASANQKNGLSTPEEEKKASKLAKENSELLFEMITVVFDVKEPENKSDFGSMVSTLNQGASLEGIYRGLVSGARYRGLESQSKAASPATLKAFALEMAEVQDGMKNPTVFRAEDAKKPFEVEYPDGSAAPSATPIEQKQLKREEVALELVKIFVGASSFTLKRVLSEEALKRMDEFQGPNGKVNVNDLAQWYGRLAERMAQTKVDFGLEQRNNGSLDFHFRWAQKMAPDRVKWEVLNRYHCYINTVSKYK